MIYTLFILLATALLPDPQTPNYYPGLTTAREASKKEQKEMVIFFSEKACTNCEAAWSAFTMDAKATSQYVSTKMDIQDFDGGIFFDLLDLTNTPSWVILHPNGTEKERWEGGWKDAGGKATLFNKEVIVTKQNIPATPMINTPAAAEKATEKKSEINTPPGKKESAENPSAGSGYFLQAGYFGSEANANKLIADLKNKGFTAFGIQTEIKDGSTFYRVASKMYSEESLALAEQQRLDAAGIKTSLKNR